MKKTDNFYKSLDKWIRKKGREKMTVEKHRNEDGSDIEILVFDALKKERKFRHLFSTRTGGVSSGIYKSMNPGFGLGDSDENVLENHRRLLFLLGAEPKDCVRSCQEHGTNVRIVTEDDRGKGIVRPRDYTNTDGFVTDVPGIVLSIYASDCVPILFEDPRHEAIGACHSGWKGTAGRIGEKTIRTMEKAFGSRPEDLICAIGPSICRNCYEVSSDVADVFRNGFRGCEDEIMTDKGNGKYLLDLQAVNRIILLEAGVPSENIHVTDICTCCNHENLFSHRATGGRRGNNAAMITIASQSL